MTDIEWGAPAEASSGRPSFRPAIAEKLKQRPGAWARVEVGVANVSYSAWHALGCEATARIQRGTRPPRYDVYARWVEDE